MISVIIPTLFKIERLYRTLIELSQCDEVGEIILIDNTENSKPIELKKLVHVREGKNIFVNPAWNKGAAMAKYEKLCFLNDDTWTDWELMRWISPHITEDKKMIGVSPYCFKDFTNLNRWWYTSTKDFKVLPVPLHPYGNTKWRPDGYASCWFIHKSQYIPIPEEMKIWAGDDWHFFYKGAQNYMIEGVTFDGEVSGTSSSEEFTAICHNDIHSIKKYVAEGIVDNYLIGTKWEN